VPTVINSLRHAYPSIVDSQRLIERIIKSEEDSFLKTLATGLLRVETLTQRIRQYNQNQLPGEDAFKLYDTYGFPIDLTQSLLKEKGLDIDMDGFKKCLEIQKKQSRTTPKPSGLDQVQDEIQINNADFSNLPLQLSIYTDRPRGGEARLISDPIEKMDMARHHSATHLLHSALRTVLGMHVTQAGSLVDTDRLRFDFVHFESISDIDLNKIETWVNLMISQDLRISCENKTLDQAKQIGAMALFGEKYESDNVRVVQIGSVSIELCGGTHVNKTSLIESFRIISETAISSGTRRIEAIAGRKWVRQYTEKIRKKRYDQILQAHLICCEIEQTVISSQGNLSDDILCARPLKGAATAEDITPLLDAMTEASLLDIIEQYASYRKLIEKIQSKRDTFVLKDCLELATSQIESIDGTKLSILALDLPQCNMKVLKMLSDDLVRRYSRLIILIGGRSGDKGLFVIKYPNELISTVGSAKTIMNDIVRCCGGNGGGRDSFITGGGANAQRLSEALVLAKTNITNRFSIT
jgi:alanyl-tRNA synthetase